MENCLSISSLGGALSGQFLAASQAPIPFLGALLVCAGVVWQVLKWRYDSVIDSLEHRIKLRDDSIKRLEEMHAKAPRSATISDYIAKLPATSQTIANDSISTTQFHITSAEGSIAESVTPDDLRIIYKDRTSIQADRLAAAYVGKSMKVSGSVTGVSQLDAERLMIRLDDKRTGDSIIAGIWLIFSEDRDFLETLKNGDIIYARGTVKSFGLFDINLTDCSLIKAE